MSLRLGVVALIGSLVGEEDVQLSVVRLQRKETPKKKDEENESYDGFHRRRSSSLPVSREAPVDLVALVLRFYASGAEVARCCQVLPQQMRGPKSGGSPRRANSYK